MQDDRDDNKTTGGPDDPNVVMPDETIVAPDEGAGSEAQGQSDPPATDDIETVEPEELADAASPKDAGGGAKGKIRLPAIRGAASTLLRKLVPSEEENTQLPVWVNWTKDRFFPDDVIEASDERSFMNTSGLIRKGNIVLGVFVIGALLWGAVVPLDSAIIARGEVVVKTHRKTIQHLEGGIVREIKVADGETVRSGQVLVVLDDAQARANLGILRGEVDALTAQEARLVAERDHKDHVEFPPEMLARASDPTVAEAIRGEQEAFESRKAALEQQVSVLGSRTGENWRMIAGLRSQRTAVQHQKELVQQEVASVDALYKQGLATLPRLLALQRQAADLNGQEGQIAEKIAQVQLSSGENSIQISRVRQEQLSQIVQDLRDVQTKRYQALDRLHAAEDTLKHTKLSSPVNGTVVALAVHTVGAVIKPGETVMEVVPKDDRLDVEAQVRPEDADELYPGMDARVNFSAYKQRSLPLITGKVHTVSADRLTDQRTGQPYFSIIVSVDGVQLKNYPDLRLMPGMPVEVEIATGSRTALQYLFSPITRAMRHGMREREGGAMILRRLGRGGDKGRGPQKPEKPDKTDKTSKTEKTSPKEAQMAPKTTTTAAPAAQRAAKPPVEDDLSAKEAFADDFVGLYSIGPNFHFTFATRRPNKNGGMSRLVTARVVLPLDAVLEMYNNLQAAVKRLETSGVVKRRGPAGNA